MRIVWRAGLLCFLLLFGSVGASRAQLPPNQQWRTFATRHFRVTYPAGLELIAARAAERAERAHALLRQELIAAPPGRIDLVLSDNVDFANGFASIVPRPRVVLFAEPPVGSRELAYYDDWLDLLLIHELAHVFHLDATRGIWLALRTVFGRHPGLFVAGTSPGWLVEGLATYLESRLTTAGRVRGTIHDMVLRTAILEGAFFDIGRATGVRTLWPGPATRYMYGSLFFDHLARTHGPGSISRFVERYAGTLVPYALDRHARASFGRTFARAWEEWEFELLTETRRLAEGITADGLTRPEILTTEGRVAGHPRYSTGGALAYVAATGVDPVGIRLWNPAGEDRTLRTLSVPGAFSWVPGTEWIVHGDLEFVDPYRIYSDLYETRSGGEARRLTRARRIQEPDVHPDGRRVVAVARVEDVPGTNALLVLDRETGSERRLTEPMLDTHWALPRWSPAGDLIAASRWSPGGIFGIVLLDTLGHVVRQVTADRAVDTGASWSPDGAHLLFSSDRTGVPNLFAYELATGTLHQVTNVLSGAFEPAVSPDGQWIAFSYYRADGYAIARIPFDPERWRAPGPLRPEAESAAVRDYAPVAVTEPRPYRAVRSLEPVAWTPLIGDRGELGLAFGAAAGGRDLVERHFWRASAELLSAGARGEGEATYRFRGLGNPVLDLSASQSWSVAATTGSGGAPLPTPLLERGREAGAAMSLVRRRWESVASASLGTTVRFRHRAWADPAQATGFSFRQRPPDLGSVLQASYSSARGFGIAIGPQQGVSLIGRVEGRRNLSALPGEDVRRGYSRVTARGRAFQPLPVLGFARQVLALRGDAAAEWGSASPGLDAGGATGAPLAGILGIPGEIPALGRSIGFPIRGYAERAQRGNRVLTASAEYRLPLVRIERGFGLLPVFLERVWGDVFADAGSAWCDGGCAHLGATNPRFDPLTSLGAELNVDLYVGYRVHLPLRLGLAVPLHPAHATRPLPYVRFGRAF